MDGPVRVTNPLLDVLEVLLDAFDEGQRELHGWAIMKAVERSGPTVYGVLDRLEDCGWITGRWESQHPEGNKPRRRFYRLTPTGSVSARSLLARRRPDTGRVTRGMPRPGLAWGTCWRGLATGGTR
jgi:PadR family transcriptional regulator, regulatory protein PadR